jgi:hypothetical protein
VDVEDAPVATRRGGRVWTYFVGAFGLASCKRYSRGNEKSVPWHDMTLIP